MVSPIKHLANKFKNIHPENPYSLGSVLNNRFFVPLYVENNNNTHAGACVELGQKYDGEVFIPYGYAIKGSNSSLVPLEHTCRATITAGSQGAIHFLSNLVSFDSEVIESCYSFQLVPHVLSAINQAENNVGLTNSPLHSKYFNVLYEQLNNGLNNFLGSGSELSSGNLYSLGGLMVNLLNMNLSSFEEGRVLSLFNNIEQLPLINAVLSDNEFMTNGFNGLESFLNSVSGSLTERLTKFNNQQAVRTSAKKKKNIHYTNAARNQQAVRTRTPSIVKRNIDEYSILQGIIKKYELKNEDYTYKNGHVTKLRLWKKRIINLNHVSNLSNLTQLQILIVVRNKLTSLPDLSNLIQLQTLNVGFNRLTSLPDLSKLTQLKTLLAGANKLTYLPDLSKLTQLQILNVHNNRLTSLPDLSKLTQLKTLLAGANKLTYLPDLSNLIQLQTLNVGFNRLTSLPDLSKLTQLKTLYVYTNRLSHASKKICKKLKKNDITVTL